MDPNDYYTLEEIMYLFNKSKSTIIREVNAGEIPYMLEPGKKRGKQYPKQAIDILVEKQKKGQVPVPRFVFSYSTINDLWSESEIGQKLHGENMLSYRMVLEWRDRNAEMFMSLKDAGRVIAYARLIPLKEDVSLALVKAKIRAKDIPLSTLQAWSTPQLSVYITHVTVKQTGNPSLDTIRGYMLLRHTLQWALKVQQLYDIKHWYGIGSTLKEQRLFEALGFQEIVTLDNGTRKGYMLNTIPPLSASILNTLMKKMKKA